jgi:hypothetical protein
MIKIVFQVSYLVIMIFFCRWKQIASCFWVFSNHLCPQKSNIW